MLSKLPSKTSTVTETDDVASLVDAGSVKVAGADMVVGEKSSTSSVCSMTRCSLCRWLHPQRPIAFDRLQKLQSVEKRGHFTRALVRLVPRISFLSHKIVRPFALKPLRQAFLSLYPTTRESTAIEVSTCSRIQFPRRTGNPCWACWRTRDPHSYPGGTKPAHCSF